MARRGRFFESPALVGCCLAIDRGLYTELRGFDRDMIEWGVEDIDLGFRAWMLGYPILHDAAASIGHRFRKRPPPYSVARESVIVNKLRMARRSFGDATWTEWLAAFRERVTARGEAEEEIAWNAAWRLFEERRSSVEAGRAAVMAARRRDEHAYAERFGLPGPRRPV